MVFSGWCFTLPESAALPAFNQLLIIVGVRLAMAMFVYQVNLHQLFVSLLLIHSNESNCPASVLL